jgi:hypothetical protein
MYGKPLFCAALAFALTSPAGNPSAHEFSAVPDEYGATPIALAQAGHPDEQPDYALAPLAESPLYYYSFVPAAAFRSRSSFNSTRTSGNGCIRTDANAMLVADVQFHSFDGLHLYWMRPYYRVRGGSGRLDIWFAEQYRLATLNPATPIEPTEINLLHAQTSLTNGYHTEPFGDDDGTGTGGITIVDTASNAYVIKLRPNRDDVEFCGIRLAYRKILP